MGVQEMRLGLAAFNATGSNVAQGLFHALLAEALIEVGEIGEAEAIIQAGIVRTQPGGDFVSSPDIQLALAALLHARGEDPTPALDKAQQIITTLGAQGCLDLLNLRRSQYSLLS